ncbi:MAG: hypothetical protein GQ532_06335 [Methylomarinum sp.]|nr:hypothetical protein [Methylomarinum sp.]
MSNEYIKKPVKIQAIQYTGDNIDDVLFFLHEEKVVMDRESIVIFTLEGHIPVIEEMLDNNCGWHEINLEIGWAGDAAEKSYARYLRKKVKIFECALNEISALPSIRQDEGCCIALNAVDQF